MTATARATLQQRVDRAAPMGLPLLIAFSAAAVGAGLGRALVTTYLPVLLDRIRDAPGLIGTVMLVNTAAGFLVPLLVGAWSDRLRARGHGRTLPVILGGTIVAAGGMVAVALGHASSYLALALFAAIAYFGLNAVTTGHRALIPQTFDEESRAPATAGEELAMLLGALAGVVAGGVLLEVEPWLPFAVGAAALPLLAVPTVRRMRDRELPPRRSVPERLGLRGYARAAGRPGVRLVLAAQALWVLGYVGLPPFFVLYAQRELDLRTSTAAFVLAAFGLVTGAAMLGAGTVKPAHQRAVLLVGALAIGAGMFAVSTGQTIVAVAPALVPVAVGFGIVTTLGFPVFSTFIPEGEEGTYSALYFATRSVSSAIALPTAGWTIAATGSYRTLFLLGGTVTLAAAIPLLRLRGSAPAEVVRAVASRAAVFATTAAATLAAAQYIHRTELQEADEALFDFLHGLGTTPTVLDELLVDPHLRNYVLLVLLAGALAAKRWGRTTPLRTALLVAGAGCVAYAGVRASWALWERPRPEEMLGIMPAGGHSWSAYPSFPSGHMAVTTALAASMAMLVRPLRVVLWSYAALVGWTRVSYGAHFPSDVLSGLVIGWVAAVVTVRPLDQPLRRPQLPSQARLRHDARAAGAVAVVTFAALFAVAGVPASPEGGLLSENGERTVQAGLLAFAALSVAAAWRHAAWGASLAVAGAALGVFAAVEFTPGFAGLAFLAFAIPGALFLLSWGRARATSVAAFMTVLVFAGAATAVEVHDRVFGAAHPESNVPAPPPGPVAWSWAGGVTHDGVTVTARLVDGGRARLVVGTDRRLRNPRASAPRVATRRNSRIVALRVTGLRPGTAYVYGVEVDGKVDRRRLGRFRTFPTVRASFTFAVGACARVESNGTVFDAIRRSDPRFLLIAGDFFYANIDDPSPVRFRDAYSRALTQPAQAALYRSVPVAYIWDDHDYGGDGSDATSASRPAARAVYDAVVPHYALDRGAGGAIYQSFDYGRVRFLMLDARSERSPADQRDGPAKTMLGARQKAWLKRELLTARDAAALTVVVSSVPWIARAGPGVDSWGAYATERGELSRFIARHRVDNILMVSGDAHMLAIDDGSHSDYSGTGRAGFPVFHAAALDRRGSVKGGPYSGGTFPGAGQFGTVRVDDRGGRVDVLLTGRRYDGRRIVEHRFRVEAAGR